LTEESRAATAHAEREIAQRWEQIVREREKLDREIAEWKTAVTATPARSSQDQDELLRISAEREQLARERELFDRRAREWETAAAAQREAISREAREEAEHALDASTQRLADLTREEEHLRRRIGEHRYELVSLLRSALSELESLDLSAAPRSEAGDLSSALTSRVSPGA
jgi:chromosome segregation ATPase